MKFDQATSYKLTSDTGQTIFYRRDDLALLIYKNNLSYKYIASSQRRGILELFNDDIDLVFDVVLFDHF